MKRAWLVVVVALSACWPFDFDQLAAQHADAGAIGGGAAPGGGPGGGSAVGGGSAGGGTVAGGGSNTGGGDDAGTPAGGGSPAGGGTSAGGGGGATGGGTSTGGGSASGGGTGTGGGTASSDAGTCFGVNGWCWQHPWPVGVPLTAVYARAPNDVWFGGNGGVLLHLTDAGLQFVSATSEFSNTVQQILPVNVLVGSGNAVLAVQGLNYASVSDEAVWVITPGGATEVGRGLLSTTPYYAATTSTGRVYLAGSSSTVEALDPPTYTPIKQRSSFTEAIIGLAVDRNDECYVTRIDYTPSPNQHMLTECSNPNRWVFPTAWSEPNWLWAGADALNIVFETDVTVQAADHYFDGGFSDGGVSPAFSIEHAFTGSDNVAFGVGSVTFVKRTPAGWVSVAPSGFDATLWAVHGTDSTNVWAVGEGGRIYNIDDAGFHQFSRSVISDYVTKLFGTETWVVASQNYGPAMIKDQTPWRSLNTARCRGGWCNGSTCICATDSQQRTQFSFDGGTWLQSHQSFPQNLWDGWFDTLDHSWFLEGPSSHSVRVVQGDVRQASATYFADVCQTPDAGLLAIHGAAGNAWVVGENGCVAELLVDGGVRSHDLTSVGSLHSVMAVGPGHAWVMSDDTAYELNDGGVTSYPVPFPSQYGSARPLWVDSSGVWVGGPNSVFHLDDAGVWQREVVGIGPARTQSDFQVTALFGNSQGLWVGGQSGSILFKHR